MIIFDVETTGLPRKDEADLSKQPKIIEFAAIKLCDKTLEKKESINFLIHPEQSISQKITEITGLKDEDFVDQLPFSEHLQTISNFFLGERILVAHNLIFDKRLLRFELQRLNMITNFPWPPIQICSMLLTTPIFGKWPKLKDLHHYLFDKHFEGSHRAINDVEALTNCVRALIEKNMIIT